MRISRNDKTPLASFDEDDYINNTNANERNLQVRVNRNGVSKTVHHSAFKSFQKDNYLEWVLLQIILFQFEFYYYCAPDASSKNISRKVFISYSRSKWTKFLLCFRKTLYYRMVEGIT
jgi:hypothetical protein